MCACSVVIFVWLMRNNLNFEAQKRAARRLAKVTGFTLAELESMPFYELEWWLKDDEPPPG